MDFADFFLLSHCLSFYHQHYTLDFDTRQLVIRTYWDMLVKFKENVREFATLKSLCDVLSMLLEKHKHDDLSLDWRALYNVYAHFAFPKTVASSYRSSLPLALAHHSLPHLMRNARRFFNSPSAVAEILSEFLPGLSFPNHNEAERCLGRSQK